MGRSMTEMGGKDKKFPATHLTLIERARNPDPVSRSKALGEILGAYWKPLYAFLYLRGTKSEDAKDLVQEFFLTFLGRDGIARFDPKAGRFRTYLIQCLKHFAADEHDKKSAKKRDGGRVRLSLDPGDEQRYREYQARGLTPDQVFDRDWALAKYQSAVDRVRRQLESVENAAAVLVLNEYVTSDPDRPGYDKLAKLSGKSPDAVRHLLERLRDMIEHELLADVRTESASKKDALEEIRWILESLGKK